MNCYRTCRLSWIRKANNSLKQWQKQPFSLQCSAPIKSNTNGWSNDTQTALWCTQHPPLSQQMCTFLFVVPPTFFKEPKQTLIYQLLNKARIFFFLTDMTWHDIKLYKKKYFLLSMFDAWEKVWSKIISKAILHIICIYRQLLLQWRCGISIWQIF